MCFAYYNFLWLKKLRIRKYLFKYRVRKRVTKTYFRLNIKFELFEEFVLREEVLIHPTQKKIKNNNNIKQLNDSIAYQYVNNCFCKLFFLNQLSIVYIFLYFILFFKFSVYWNDTYIEPTWYQYQNRFAEFRSGNFDMDAPRSGRPQEIGTSNVLHFNTPHSYTNRLDQSIRIKKMPGTRDLKVLLFIIKIALGSAPYWSLAINY